MRVLMVCTGNICRSITAHTVLEQQIQWYLQTGDRPDGTPLSKVDRNKLEAVVVDSAGISDEEHGNPIDYRSAKALIDGGYQVPEHRARQVNPRDFEDFDLLLAMTNGHLRCLQAMGTQLEAPAGKIKYYRSYDPQASTEDIEVSDPWYDGNFKETLATIERTTPKLIEAILDAE